VPSSTAFCHTPPLPTWDLIACYLQEVCYRQPVFLARVPPLSSGKVPCRHSLSSLLFAAHRWKTLLLLSSSIDMVKPLAYVVLLGLIGPAAYAVALHHPTRVMPLGASIVEEVRSLRQPLTSLSLSLSLSITHAFSSILFLTILHCPPPSALSLQYLPAYRVADVLASLRLEVVTQRWRYQHRLRWLPRWAHHVHMAWADCGF
jgi:hypothetical protein